MSRSRPHSSIGSDLAYYYRARLSSSSSSSSTGTSLSTSSSSTAPSDHFDTCSFKLGGSSDKELTSASEDDCTDDDSASSSSLSTDDEEGDYNSRAIHPYWETHRRLLENHGIRLDTFRDVKLFYERYWEEADAEYSCGCEGRAAGSTSAETYATERKEMNLRSAPGYVRACRGERECREGGDGLCRDAGLHDCLFRGKRIRDGLSIMVKAVHIRSRELAITRMLSSPTLRKCPSNHTIPILDIIEAPNHGIAFIVQEEWSPDIIVPGCKSCTLRDFLQGIRSCIDGLAFMHSHNIVHLDISLRNILTNRRGRYCYIDFETSMHFPRTSRHSGDQPRINKLRATEIPPEIERGADSDPFKVDIWQLGMLILNASRLAGYDTVLPELTYFVRPLLLGSCEARPPAVAVLHAFDCMVKHISEQRLKMLGHR